MTRVTEKPVEPHHEAATSIRPGAPVLSVRTQLRRRQHRGDGAQRGSWARPQPRREDAASSQPWTLPVCVDRQPASPRCQLVTDGHRDLPRAGLRRRLRQRRRPRLLLHGIRAGGDRRAGRRDAAPDRGGARQPARRRVADDARRTARHRHLSRPGRGLRRRPDARRRRRDRQPPRLRPRRDRRPGAAPTRSRLDSRARFRPVLDRHRRRAEAGDSDDVLTPRGTLLQLLGDRRRYRAAGQARARWPRATSPIRRRCRRRSSRRCCRWPPPVATPRSTTATSPRPRRR